MKQWYPTWVCGECAEKYGGIYNDGHVSCWHMDWCDVCGKTKAVTEPRDYMFPRFPERADYERRDKQEGSQQEEANS